MAVMKFSSKFSQDLGGHNSSPKFKVTHHAGAVHDVGLLAAHELSGNTEVRIRVDKRHAKMLVRRERKNKQIVIFSVQKHNEIEKDEKKEGNSNDGNFICMVHKGKNESRKMNANLLKTWINSKFDERSSTYNLILWNLNEVKALKVTSRDNWEKNWNLHIERVWEAAKLFMPPVFLNYSHPFL